MLVPLLALTAGVFACRGRGGAVAGPGAAVPTASASATAPRRMLAIGREVVCISGTDARVLCSSHPGEMGWVPNDKNAFAEVKELEGVVEMSFQMSTTCARVNDGTVRCWGVDSDGALGNGRILDRPAYFGGEECPMPGGAFAAPSTVPASLGKPPHDALPPAGSTTTWFGSYGVGAPVTSTPTPVLDVHDAVQLIGDVHHYCVRSEDGVVRCWGGSLGCHAPSGAWIGASVPITIAGLPPVRSLAGANVVIAANGDIVRWHAANVTVPNETPSFPSEVALRVPTAVQVVWSGCTGCARFADGTVQCMGCNPQGLCGTGSTQPWVLKSLQTVDGIDHAIDLTLGTSHACVLHANGTASCWGSSFAGQLGNGVMGEWAAPLPVRKLDHIVQIVAGQLTTCALRSDDSLWCWGELPNGERSPIPKQLWKP